MTATDKPGIGPQPGPQVPFLTTVADVIFFGGAAGGGKTYALALAAAAGGCMRGPPQYGGIDVPGYRAVLFRRTFPELKGGGGLWQESMNIYPRLPSFCKVPRPVEGKLLWVWPHKPTATIEMRHFADERFLRQQQGLQWAFIGLDELTHFPEHFFWWLISRNRNSVGLPSFLRATCNPEPGWVAEFLMSGGYVSRADGYAVDSMIGVVRWFARADDDTLLWADRKEDLPSHADGTPRAAKSFTFIPSDLSDNKILEEKDPGYRESLGVLDSVTRARLLGNKNRKGGNWKIVAGAGSYFRREFFRFVVKEPDVVHWARGWDKAASVPSPTNPDPGWTVGVRVGLTSDRRLIIDGRNICRIRETPNGVERAMRRCATQDGVGTQIGIWQDPGQAGVVDRDHMISMLRGFTVKSEVARQSKETYWGPVSSEAEQGLIDILLPPDGREPPELTAFLATLQSVPDGEHDDDADALARAHMLVANPPTYRYRSAKTDKSRYIL